MVKKKGKTTTILFVLVLLLTIITGTILLLSGKNQGYSNNPSDWVESKTGGVKDINLAQVSKGSGFMDEIGQQLRFEDIDTVFDLQGFYQGKQFNTEYVDENGPLMRITDKLVPNNGVIEGLLVEVIEEDEPVVYIFVDEDWKTAMPQTNIFWGIDYQNEQAFSFNEIENGVYMQRIADDASRFSHNFRIHRGGVVVGDLTKEDAENKTLIQLI